MEKVKARVLRVDDDSHKFVVEFKDRQFRIKQFRFQHDQALPQELDCVYEEHSDGRAFIRQDIEKMMRQFHAEGENAVFTVKNIHAQKIILEDKQGFMAVMPRRNDISRATTQELLCHITKIGSIYMHVTLQKFLETKANDIPNLAKALNALSGHRQVAEQLTHLVHDTFTGESERMVCHDFISQWAGDASLIGKIHETANNIFDNDTVLRSCATIADRTRMEQRLSMIIDQIDYCLKAAELIAKDKADDYAEDLLRRVARSGYSHHLSQKLYTLLFLFKLNNSLLCSLTPTLLSTLRSLPIETWQRHPYQGLFVCLLQCYISYAIQREQHFTLSTDEKRLLIQVIAMQSALDDKGRLQLVDTVLNKAMLYRLCSEMKVNDPRSMLEHALLNLVSDPTEKVFDYNEDSDDVDVTANILYNQITDDAVDEVMPEVFETDHVAISLNADSVSIAPLSIRSDHPYQPLRNMGLAHHLDIRLGEKPQIKQAGNAATSIDVSKRLWNEIDASLFTDQPVVKQVKRHPEAGTQTWIIVTHIVPSKDQKIFGCRIVDDDLEGEGTLCINDIVGYYPGDINENVFMHEGHPLVLPATIKQVNSDGSCVFTMKEDVEEFVDNYFNQKVNWTTRMTCVLNNRIPNMPRVPGVSTNGFPMSIEPGNGLKVSDLKKGLIVEVCDIKKGPEGYLNATYAGEAPQTQFNFKGAFHQFLMLLSEGEVYIDDEERENESQKALMDESHAKELLSIVGTMASLETDYMRRYNHLAFCRTLAKALGLEAQEAYFDLRMHLVEGLKFFEKNRFVQQSFVDVLELQHQLIVDRRLRVPSDQLRVLSLINNETTREVLLQTTSQETDKQVRDLASLVVSHNLVKQMGLFDQAEDIMEKIFERLNLKWTQSTKKYYGSENEKTEFKQSIVYPAGAMVENIDEQMHVILKVICSFLNEQGGRLFIGVNDPGYEMGIANDLKHKLFNGDLDKYKRYIRTAILAQLGQEADHYVRRMELDRETKSQVLIVEIDPCPTPVSLDGIYYQRHGSTSQPLHEPYLSKFLSLRSSQFELTAIKENTTTKFVAKPTSPAYTPIVAPVAPPTDVIATSTKRNNVLHNYDEGYEQAVAFIGLLPHAEYCILKEEDWETYDLKLAVHQEEADGWLFLVYEDGFVAKIDMEKLLEKDARTHYKRFADEKLLFASVVTDADTLAIGMLDSKGNHYMRFDDVAQIEETTTMQGHGTQLAKVSNEGIYYCDSLPIASVDESLKRNMGTKNLGIVMKTTFGTTIRQLFPTIEA